MSVRKAFVVFGLVVGLGFELGPIWAQQVAPDAEVEFDELREILLKARPVAPQGRYYDQRESDDPLRHSRISINLITGEETSIPSDPADASGPTVGVGKRPEPARRADGWAAQWAPAELGEDPASINRDGRSCSPPPRSLATHDYPWNTTYKLLMRFDVSGTDYYLVCSASSFGSFHLLTAGHCIYNHDPNGDGNTADAKWADEIWAWAAQTDVVNPFGGADYPYGFAKVTILDTYYGWIDNQDLNFDVAYVALDRRVGDRTGWMWREANLTTSMLNFNGYPAETPYVPAGELAQYPGSDSGNVLGYTTDRIQMCAYTYGGHSGGPVWRYDPGTGNRFVQGVNSTSTRVGYAEATRLTTERLGHMDGRITNDSINVPPVARPDVTEFVFSYVDDTKDLSPNVVSQGQTFFVKYSLINAGFANTGAITVDFYLSTNATISTLDTKVGTATLGGIDGSWYYIVPDMPLVANVDPGAYWVGWIMRSAVPEYGGDLNCTNDPCSNVVVVADETLTVTFNAEIFSDGFESAGTAAWN